MKIKQCSFIDFRTMKKVRYLVMVLDAETRVNFYPQYRNTFGKTIKNGLWINSTIKKLNGKVLHGEEALGFLVSQGPLFNQKLRDFE